MTKRLIILKQFNISSINYYPVVTMLIIALSLQSCKQQKAVHKDDDIRNITSVEDRTLAELKVKYNDLVIKFGAKAKFIGTPDWEKMSAIGDGRRMKRIVRVPLIGYNVNTAYTREMNPNGYRELVFSNAYGNDLTLFVAEIHPDAGSPPQITNGEVNQNAFNGYYLTYSLENNLLQGHHRTNGVADKYIQVPETIYQNTKIFN